MIPIHSVLAATDFSTGAAKAVRRATQLAIEHGAEVDLLHVISGPGLKAIRELFGAPQQVEAGLAEDANHRLHNLARRVARQTGTPPRTQVRSGKVAEEIIATAESADLLIMGARGSTALRDVFLGTTTDRVLHKCPRPVLIVKRPAFVPYENVLVPVGHGPTSTLAVRLAARLAPHADMTVLHAFSVPFEARLNLAGVAQDDIDRYRLDARHEAVRHVDSILRDVDTGDRLVRRSIEPGEAPRLILRREKELEADLIVIGKHGDSLLDVMFLGSVTRHVIGGSKCDVLVVGEEAEQQTLT